VRTLTAGFLPGAALALLPNMTRKQMQNQILPQFALASLTRSTC
jgi:hypothetical protein